LTLEGYEDTFGAIAYGSTLGHADGLLATFYCGDPDHDDTRDPREFLVDSEREAFVIPLPTPTNQQGILFPSDRFMIIQ